MIQFLQIFCFLIIQFFALSSREPTPYGDYNYSRNNDYDTNYNYDNLPHAVIHVYYSNDQFPNSNEQSVNSWKFSTNVRLRPDYPNQQSSVNYNYASPQLKQFLCNITSLMYFSTVANHYCALPGYALPEGLRYCVNALSQFNSSDPTLISHITQRLNTYCARIENILYDKKHDVFRDKISRDDQIALVHIYADFLKEFYSADARYVFDYFAQTSPLMQQVRPEIKWCCYDDKTIKSKIKDQQLLNVASLNGNLGAMYKALHEGNSKQAYIIGHEGVKTVVGKKEKITSVFERYPALRKIVEQALLADKAKAEQIRLADQARLEQERIAKELHAQQEVAKVKDAFIEELLSYDKLQQRCDTAVNQINNPRFFEKFYALVAEHVPYIDMQHLTSDQKGILFEGGHFQHHLVDEMMSVVDTAISGNLVDTMQDAVIDLANSSLSLNKEGDVVQATCALDTCWALINCAQNAACYAYAGILSQMNPVERGIYHGVVDSIGGAVDAVLHPIKTVQETAQSLATAGYCLGKLAYAVGVYDAACDVLESDPKRYEQMIAQYEIDPDALVAIYEHAKNNASIEDVVRFGTKTAVDTMLLHSVTKAVSAITKDYWTAVISCMRKGEQSAEAALTAENLPVQCGEEIASIMHKMESTQKTGSRAEVVAEITNASTKNVDKIERTTESISKVGKKYGKQGSSKTAPATHARPLDKLKGKELIGIENVTMQGYGDLPKKISLDNYKHYLQPEIKITSKGKLKLSGWHHDPLKRIENIKRFNGKIIEIENYTKHPSGIYKFDWIINKIEKKTSTFFPHTWSREIVQEKIVEAYKYARKYCIPVKQPNGNFAVTGFTAEGINIKIIINKNGSVVTAYPIWPK